MSPADPTAPFVEILNHHRPRFRRMAAEGKRFIGYFCTYTPVEIIHASGFVPVRISGDPGPVEQAYAHVPDFICPFMKLAFEKALTGETDFISGVVQGYTCDVACGMVNIWKTVFPDHVVHTVPIPYNDVSAARSYYRMSLQELVDRLDTAGGSFSETALNRSLELYGTIRRQLLALYEGRYDGRLALDAGDLLTIVRTGFVAAPEEYTVMLERVRRVYLNDNALKKKGVPVLLSGSLIEARSVLDAVEAAGGRIVADDLCTGWRSVYPADSSGGNPLDRLVDRTFERFPCPARSRATTRAKQLLTLMNRSGARGVILLVQKFCTPHLADVPILSAELKKNGFPVLLLEIDETWRMEGQLKTRLESFFEMAEGAGGPDG